MFSALSVGIYSAYKHFAGLDPLKFDPEKFIGLFPRQVKEKILGQSQIGSQPQPQKKAKPIFSFILVADSHSDNANLRKALVQAKPSNPQFIIGLGDYSDVGIINELQNAKKEFDSTGLRYFLAVGDHDLWDCRNRNLAPNCNFEEVFGPSYQSFTYDQFSFIILDNSDNYLGMREEQWKWLFREFHKAEDAQVKGIYVFIHEPLYHPSSDHFMGRVEGNLKTEARNLIRSLSERGVKKVFSGDTHYFSQYSDSETNLSMVTIGAITGQRNVQAPRYGIVTIFEDGSVGVEDVEIK